MADPPPPSITVSPLPLSSPSTTTKNTTTTTMTPPSPRSLSPSPRPVSVSLQSPPPKTFTLPSSIITDQPPAALHLSTPNTNPFFDRETPTHASSLSSATYTSPSSSTSPQSHQQPHSANSALRKDRRRSTRRSTDVLNHLKAIDDENKARPGGAHAPRETTTAAITTDDIGGLMGVNQYVVLKELGKGAFAEVKLCRKQVGGAAQQQQPGSPESASGGGGGSGDGATSPDDMFSSPIASGTGTRSSPPPPSSPSRAKYPTTPTTTAHQYSTSSSTSTISSPPPNQKDNSHTTNQAGQGDLFAIKIFSKSLLLRRRQINRSREGRLNVTTDLDKVQKEIAIMKKLIHPHLVHLYEVIDDISQDALYLVLEYVPGGAIMEYNADEKRYYYHPHTHPQPPNARSPGLLHDGTMSEIKAAKVISDVLAGLVYLHMHHICHRDLKPENVLVDQYGRCKIADFGVAHYFEEEEAKKGQPNELNHLYRSHSRGLLSKSDGTWCFWAPEMCKTGGGASFSGYGCDVWAAGVCLWVFVFGTLPFNEESPDELFEAIVEKEAVLPSEGEGGGKSVSVELEDLLRQFLVKVPADRITVGDALDHPWSQLADDEEEGMAGTITSIGEEEALGLPSPIISSNSLTASEHAAHRSALRTRAYSFQKIHVTPEEINGAIRSVNNFVLVNKLKKRLTQKLRDARASLSRVYSPAVSPSHSSTGSPDQSRPSSPSVSASTHTHTHTRSASSSPPPPPQQQGGGGGKRRSSFSSPYSFLPPMIVAALSGGASPTAAAAAQQQQQQQQTHTHTQQHRKNTMSVSGSRAAGGSGSGAISPSSPRSSLLSDSHTHTHTHTSVFGDDPDTYKGQERERDCSVASLQRHSLTESNNSSTLNPATNTSPPSDTHTCTHTHTHTSPCSSPPPTSPSRSKSPNFLRTGYGRSNKQKTPLRMKAAENNVAAAAAAAAKGKEGCSVM